MSHTENILGMLSSTIDQRNDLMITPPWVAKDMVNLLPEEVWNKDTTFLDPACKSGIFLHEIYLKLMETESLIKEFPDKAERRKHILQNQLYGIALNPMCQLTTARTVYGTIKGENNIKLIDNYITIVKNKDTKFFKEAIKEQFGEMKFDVVIGNPPYQDSNGGGGNSDGGKAIYQLFINKALDFTSEFVCMITKNTWYRTRDTGGNKGFNELKKQLLDDGMIVKVVDFPKYGEVFADVGCAVSYFLADKNKKDKNYEFISVIDGKVDSQFKAKTLTKDLIRGEKLTSIAIKSTSPQNMSRYTISKLAFGIDTTGVFEDSAVRTEVYNTKLISNRGNSYINNDNITRNSELIDNYKVICTRAVSAWSGKKENVITSIQLLKPYEVCTGTYSIIYYSSDELSARNAEKYIKTMFVRELLRCLIDARGVINGNTFEYVPLQDFTEHSDIDWSQSIADIDQQLYKKYNLTDEEIAYIEKTIKPMQ